MKKFVLILVLIILLIFGGFYFRSYLFPGFYHKTLRIVMNTEASDLSPYGLNLNNITRTGNIYEGLVAFDKNLKIIPALAVSWGNTDDTTWEFRLRQGVKFHDGSDLTSQDIINSFEKAIQSKDGQILSNVNNIKKIELGDKNHIVIHTLSPDPLLLSKLTKIFIYHKDHVGTGPYQFEEWIPGEHLSLKAFPDYWGTEVDFKKVRYDVVKNRKERENEFNNNEIDILVGLTEDQALKLPKEQVKSIYGLEVNFLMFKLDDPIFKNRKIREVLSSIIDPKYIEAIGNHFVRESSQFVAPGVYGYNKNIPYHTYKIDNNKNIFGKHLERLNFDYLFSYETLSEYLLNQFKKVGFSVRGNAIDAKTLLDKISKNESQLFLIGWRAEDGDAGGFFDNFIHSDAPFNHGRYKNSYVDRLIEKSRSEMNPKKRLLLLQEISKRVNEDLIGIPLYESSRLYAQEKNIQWSPRIDGQVLAKEVRKK